MTGPREENAFASIAQNLPLIARDLGMIRKVLVESAEAKAREEEQNRAELKILREFSRTPKATPELGDKVELPLVLTVEQWKEVVHAVRVRAEHMSHSPPENFRGGEAERVHLVKILDQTSQVLREALGKVGI